MEEVNTLESTDPEDIDWRKRSNFSNLFTDIRRNIERFGNTTNHRKTVIVISDGIHSTTPQDKRDRIERIPGEVAKAVRFLSFGTETPNGLLLDTEIIPIVLILVANKKVNGDNNVQVWDTTLRKTGGVACYYNNSNSEEVLSKVWACIGRKDKICFEKNLNTDTEHRWNLNEMSKDFRQNMRISLPYIIRSNLISPINLTIDGIVTEVTENGEKNSISSKFSSDENPVKINSRTNNNLFSEQKITVLCEIAGNHKIETGKDYIISPNFSANGIPPNTIRNPKPIEIGKVYPPIEIESKSSLNSIITYFEPIVIPTFFLVT
ncbi:MAG: hypothetical protein AB1414_21110 [bacterium]